VLAPFLVSVYRQGVTSIYFFYHSVHRALAFGVYGFETRWEFHDHILEVLGLVIEKGNRENLTLRGCRLIWRHPNDIFKDF